MKIAMIGTGYVGLTTGALFADRGNKVVCVDNNPLIVENLNSGKIHIFEPGLKKVVERNIENNNLTFTEDLSGAVSDSDLIFLAVGTPSNEDGSFNLEYLNKAAEDVAKAIKNNKTFKAIICKSTVPQGTWKIISDTINQTLGSEYEGEWAYVSNPETLAEGTAVKDFSKPDRIIIGTHSNKAFNLMKELYHPFNIKRDRIIKGSPASAELAKLFSNTHLAGKVTFMNEMARIAEITKDADMNDIRKMMCEDKRIGYNFMFPGPGYGGSCFPKDVQGLVHQSMLDGYTPSVLSQIHKSNEEHKNHVGKRINRLLKKDNPKIAVWGLTFKPNTDDMRDAASIPILTGLINRGAEIVAYDPQDEKARDVFQGKINYVNNKYDAVRGADALVLLTEWKEFDAPDYTELKNIMNGNQLFDMRNRWLPEAANRNGFNYYGVGRNYPLK
jgi:UDPglucose 6-dehydrogenase